MRIVVTGGIASGKSTVGRFIREAGYKIIDTDEEYHKMLMNDVQLNNKLIRAYGTDILSDITDRIDRRKLSKIILELDDMDHLNEITRLPLMLKLQELLDSTKEDIFVEIPLYFEGEIQSLGLFDKVILVTTLDKIKKERLMKRNGFDESEADRRMSYFLPDEEKIHKSD